MTTARRTSIYSLRIVETDEVSALPSMMSALTDLEVQRLDSHTRVEDGQPYAAVGFRAADDEAARRISYGVLQYLDYSASTGVRLFTGFGQHRREVDL